MALLNTIVDRCHFKGQVIYDEALFEADGKPMPIIDIERCLLYDYTFSARPQKERIVLGMDFAIEMEYIWHSGSEGSSERRELKQIKGSSRYILTSENCPRVFQDGAGNALHFCQVVKNCRFELVFSGENKIPHLLVKVDLDVYATQEVHSDILLCEKSPGGIPPGRPSPPLDSGTVMDSLRLEDAVATFEHMLRLVKMLSGITKPEGSNEAKKPDSSDPARLGEKCKQLEAVQASLLRSISEKDKALEVFRYELSQKDYIVDALLTKLNQYEHFRIG